MAKKPKVERRTISVVRRKDVEPNEWLVEWPLGEVTVALTPEQAMGQIRAWAAKIAKRLDAVIVASINWYNADPDFDPPRDDNDVRREDRVCGLGDTVIKEQP
jgi:hypothetical protein